MTSLVKKEIHLLLPGCCRVLVLEAVAPWLARDPEMMFNYTPLALSGTNQATAGQRSWATP
jgi:hypothetical protein